MKMLLRNLILCTLLYFTRAIPEIGSVSELGRSDGYDVETHKVETEDGYILTIHRIAKSKSSEPSNHLQEKERPVVLLGHCALCSSAIFMVLGPTRGLAYKLFNDGYDVWLLNNRGTPYSKEHKSLSVKSIAFWKYGLHEQGIYDLPATTDYILNTTNQSQLDYMGYSMGTTQFFMFLAEKPEYNDKIRSMVALAPAAYVNGSSGLMPSLSPFSKFIIQFGIDTETYEMPPPSFKMRELMVNFCSPNVRLLRPICFQLINSFGAETNGNINMKLVPFFLKYFPGSISLRGAAHFSQLRESGKFEKFNFGQKKNMKVYGSRSPPLYDISKITVPVSIFWGAGDNLSNPDDVRRLRNELPNVAFVYQVPDQKFSHMDFVWGKNAHSLVYDMILERLKKPETYRRMK